MDGRDAVDDIAGCDVEDCAQDEVGEESDGGLKGREMLYLLEAGTNDSVR